MWIKKLMRCLFGLQKKYEVEIIVRTSCYDDCLEFIASKGYFRMAKIWDGETICALVDHDAFEMALEDIAKQVADAYDSTSKSKAWDETLQEIGVREG